MRIHLGCPKHPIGPLALTIGNFDGVHLGHQAILHALRESAHTQSLPAGLVTFEPHPKEFFAPDEAPARLAPLREKLELLRAAALDEVIVLRFNHSLASLSPDDFIEHILVHRLNVRWLLVGDDFRFGARRAGDFQTLRTAGERWGFECFSLSTLLVNGQRVSSSAVREALAAGDMDRARQFLGHWYAISGRVVPGRQLGRLLGFPTANLKPRQKRLPLSGVFAVSVAGIGPTPLPGVASLGTRPTIEQGGEFLLEVHLLDFDASLYGARIQVNFLRKLRDETRFDSLDTLTRQMALDVAEARAFFSLGR